MTQTEEFIRNYREAFGEGAELPLLFWYSETPAARPAEKIPGCLFKCLTEARSGIAVSLDAGSIGCGGGKFYTGFAAMPPHVPEFVSLKERYKKTPAQVRDYLSDLGVPPASGSYLNLVRIDLEERFDDKEGVLFLPTPDMLAGLTTWAFFDDDSPDAVSAPFGSGCCSVFTQTVLENRRGGHRTFLGFFDPSVRPYIEANRLSYAIPVSRFGPMCRTMRESCLFDTHAWGKVRARIIGDADR